MVKLTAIRRYLYAKQSKVVHTLRDSSRCVRSVTIRSTRLLIDDNGQFQASRSRGLGRCYCDKHPKKALKNIKSVVLLFFGAAKPHVSLVLSVGLVTDIQSPGNPIPPYTHHNSLRTQQITRETSRSRSRLHRRPTTPFAISTTTFHLSHKVDDLHHRSTPFSTVDTSSAS